MKQVIEMDKLNTLLIKQKILDELIGSNLVSMETIEEVKERLGIE